MRRPLLAFVVLLSLVAGACSSGGGDDDSSTSTTRRPTSDPEFEQFVADAVNVCYDAKQARLNRAMNVPRYAEDLITSADEGVRGMQALTPPADQAAEIQENLVDPYVRANQVWLDAAPALRESAAQSWDALQVTVGPLVLAYLQSWTRTNTDWLRDNDLTDCMPDYELFLRAE